MKPFFKKFCMYTPALFVALLFFMPLNFGGMGVAKAYTDQVAQNVTENARVDATNASLIVRVAPGELLPIAVKLSNFGSDRKVDVVVTCEIFNSKGEQIYTTTETVAVETTASFIKTIQIPFGTPPGKYIAKSSIAYQDQLVPATTQFPFVVENKIIGLFQSDFYLYGFLALVVGIITSMIIGHFWMKKSRYSRLTPYEYPQISKKERIFYEIISDTIMHMRYRVGDKALDIAKSVEDLVIDENSGRVIKIKANPAKIIALLILKYEKLLGQKVSFAIKKTGENVKDRLGGVDEDLIVIKKQE